MTRGWKAIVVVAVLLLIAWYWRTHGGRAPDERLADHGRAICKIAERGVEAPDEGVKRLFHYHGEHGPAMAREWAELLVLIERIDDDAAHDERARLAAKRTHEPLRRCARTLDRFAKAIEKDPAAKQRFERGLQRLSRTLEILGGKRGLEWLAPIELEVRDATR